MSGDFRDFIPEGEENVNAKSLFVDFYPDPTLEQIEDEKVARIARNTKKVKEPVVLSEADLKAAQEMEAESIAENGVTAPEVPTETIEEEISEQPVVEEEVPAEPKKSSKKK